MADDFYVVLGIPRDADLKQIKNAYRRLVKRVHPDKSRPSTPSSTFCSDPDVDAFLQVREAYQVLSDPEARQRYDVLLADLDAESTSNRAGRPIASTHSDHLRPTPGSQPAMWADRWTALDEWLGGFLPGVASRSRPRNSKDLFVEIILSRAEAQCGGRLPLAIPYERACDACAARGCPLCGGRGWRAAHHPLELSVPPGIETGARHRLPLAGLGVPGVDLIVLITIVS